MKFEVTGTFKAGREMAKFTKEVEAESEDLAVEKVYALLGSEHRTKRPDIDVESVEKL